MTAQCSAVYSQYGFAIYPLVIRATGARCIEVPARNADDAMPYGHDLDAMARAIASDTRLVFIANPNNPTGTWVDRVRLREFIAAAPSHTLVVLDEAYVEYARLTRLRQRPAVVAVSFRIWCWCARFPRPTDWPACGSVMPFRIPRSPMH